MGYFIMTKRTTVVIDTDPGIDDAVALMMAIASPDIDIKAVTAVFGNVDVDKAFDNIRRVFSVCGMKKMPLLGKGAANSLSAEPYKPRFVHGVDGLGNTDLELSGAVSRAESADEVIKRAVTKGEIDLFVALGPLTNIARILIEEPVIKDSIKEILIMGGSVFTAGNATNEAEFNFYQDPEAAKVVLNSKIPVKLVSLDLTRQILFTRDLLKRIRRKKDSPLSRFIHSMFDYALDYHKRYKERDGIYLPDVLAMCAVINGGVVSYKDLSLDVDIKKDKGRVFDNLEAGNTIKFCGEINKEMAVNMFVDGINGLIEGGGG